VAACARAPAGRRADPPDAARAGPALLAGAAARVITPVLGDPARPVYLGGAGIGVRATEVHDDLFARALVVTDRRGAGLGLVVLDLIGFFHDDVEAVREELRARRPDVRLDHLAVASTHTHSGPDVLGLWTPPGGSVDGAYVARVRALAVQAVVEAWERRRPAEVIVGGGAAPGLAEDTRLPRVLDERVMALGLRGAGSGGNVASLAAWSSHPTVVGEGNTAISADFPRAVVSALERDRGGVGLYVSGALGGQIGSRRVRLHDPETGGPPSSDFRRAEILGDRIGRIAVEALRRAEAAGALGDAALGVRSREIFLPVDNPRFAAGLVEGRIRPRRLFPREGGGPGRLPGELPDRWSLRPGAFSVQSEVAVVEIGEVILVLVPGEPYPELVIGGIQDPQDPGADFPGGPAEEPLASLAAGRPVVVVGLANDEVGYIIPSSQWDSEPPYAYGRSRPQYGEENSLGPETAPRILEALGELLKVPVVVP
jgi:hypothetical protein